MNDLNRVSSVSTLTTSLTALANEGLFELTRVPFTDMSLGEEPGLGQVKKQNLTKFRHNFVLLTRLKLDSSVVSAKDNETAHVNEGRQVSSKSPSLARAAEDVMSKEMDET